MDHTMERTDIINGTGRFVRDVGFPAAIATALLYILDRHIADLTVAVTTNQLTLIQILDSIKTCCR